jgi:MoxR-like ATPase
MAMAAAPAALEAARQRLLTVEKKLNEMVIGHEDFIRALLVASVAGEHIVVIGPQGTSKSYAVRLYAQMLNARFFKYQLTRFSVYDELFGAIDIAELAKTGTLKRNWSKIIASEFVFLDEIFKANSAILNALLSLLQERVVYDPITGSEVSAALHTCIGASNEVPEDPELAALYDRFAVKVFIDYLGDDAALLRALEARWLNSAPPQPIATMNDVKALHAYALRLITAKVATPDGRILGDVYKIYHLNAVPVARQLRSQGIVISDRSLIEKLPKLLAAFLALYGVTQENVLNGIFDLIVYTARTREEVNAIKKRMEDALGEVAELARKLEKAKEFLRALNLGAAEKELTDIVNTDVESFAKKTPWLKPRVEVIIAEARQYLKAVSEMADQLKRMAGGGGGA